MHWILLCLLWLVQGEQFQILHSIRENTEAVAVVIYNQIRFLLYGECIIGAQWENEQSKLEAAFPGFGIMQASAYLNRELKRAIQIGLGAGTVPTFLRNYGIATDVVELSPAVVELATRYFDYIHCSPEEACPHGRTFIENGLEFLQQPPQEQYDLFIIDVYTGSNVIAFYTIDVFQKIKEQWLVPSGVLVVNYMGYSAGPHTILGQSIKHTAQAAFEHVHCYREDNEATSLDAANIIFFCAMDAFEFHLPNNAVFTHPEPGTIFEVMRHFPEWEVFQEIEKTIEMDVEQSVGEVKFKEHTAPSSNAVLLTASMDTNQFNEANEAIASHMHQRVIDLLPNDLWNKLDEIE